MSGALYDAQSLVRIAPVDDFRGAAHVWVQILFSGRDTRVPHDLLERGLSSRCEAWHA